MSEFACPECGGKVWWDFTCHTWPQTTADGKEQWMACLGCDSAIEYLCDNCFWCYTDGLNPRSPRTEANEQKRPAWLITPPLTAQRDRTAMAGIPWFGDRDE